MGDSRRADRCHVCRKRELGKIRTRSCGSASESVSPRWSHAAGAGSWAAEHQIDDGLEDVPVERDGLLRAAVETVTQSVLHGLADGVAVVRRRDPSRKVSVKLLELVFDLMLGRDGRRESRSCDAPDGYQMTWPPSTRRSMPVTNDAAPLSRKMTGPTMSSGWAFLPRGVSLAYPSIASRCSGRCVIGV